MLIDYAGIRCNINLECQDNSVEHYKMNSKLPEDGIELING